MNPPETEVKHIITWNATNDCTFEATIINNLIAELHFCEPPAKVEDKQQCLKSTNEPYLRQTMANLIEMFAFIDNNRNTTATFSNNPQLEKVA